MKKFFHQDKAIVGIVSGLGCMLAFVLLLTAGLLIAGQNPIAHIRWYAGMFIPLILLLQHYMKRQQMMHVGRTLIILFFVTFLAFIIYLLRSRALSLQ